MHIPPSDSTKEQYLVAATYRHFHYMLDCTIKWLLHLLYKGTTACGIMKYMHAPPLPVMSET